MVRRKSNLRDVAAHAEVSVATVSRVLNSPQKVSAATRNRVQAAIEELRFVPSAAARAINSGRSGMVAALIPTIDNAIYARVIDGLEAGLADRQLALMVAQIGDDPLFELARARQLVDLGAEALIVVGITHETRLFDLMDRAQIPIVAISYFDQSAPLPTVGYDNWQAATLAAEHLASLGHSKVAVLHGQLETNDRMRRRKEALLSCEIEIDFDFVEVPISMAGGHSGISQLLDGDLWPSAILCFSDVIAHGALSSLSSRGLRVPHDVSVMGMEDLPGSRFTWPPLTSVKLSVEEMGVQAADAVASWLTDGEPPKSVCLPVELVARQTTAKVRT